MIRPITPMITNDMDVTALDLPDVKLIKPKKFGDHRGFFSEVFSAPALCAAGIERDWVQDNHSLSQTAGTVRGLHFQLPPMAQAKLIRVVRGAILDIAVDVRRRSPTFGRHVVAELSADNWSQMFVPEGFAHGFVTLVENTEVIYKVSKIYSPPHERGVCWNDADLAIDWRVTQTDATLSARDKILPLLRDAVELF